MRYHIVFLRGIDMNFSKKQLLIFSTAALVLVTLLSTSTIFSSLAVIQYLRTANTVNYVTVTTPVTVPVTEPVSTGETAVPVTDASGQIIGTTQVTIDNAATNGPTAATSPTNGATNNMTTAATNNNGTAGTTVKQTAKVPATPAEIAALYVTANNNVKTKAKKATLTYRNATNYKGFVEAGALSSVGKLLMDRYLKEEPDLNEAHTDDIAAKFPPVGTTSHLTAADINKATCVDKGSFYFVTILLKPDKNPKAGYGSGSICNVINTQEIYDAASAYVDISNIVLDYDGVYCEADIDKATGNLTKLYTKVPMYLGLHAEKIGIGVDAKVGLQFEEKWTVNY